MKNESEDKVVYHNNMAACTRRLDDLEKLARSGSVTTPTPRSIYDPFQKMPPLSQGNRSAVSDLNDRLGALEGTIRLLEGADAGKQVVPFSGLGFSTIADSMAWLDQNPDSIKFGYFIDVYNLCLLVDRDINGETDYCQKMQTAK